ncbi:MAG: PepSY domain-containing protein [Rhodobacteraceae bacterium]|nr:PepSY domain-containing protein [Paracoccaceae bacterium]
MPLRTLPALAAAPLLAAAPALADPRSLVGRSLGTTPEAITAALQAEGYEVLAIDTDDAEYEIEVRWQGARHEIEVARDTGVVREVERDD